MKKSTCRFCKRTSMEVGAGGDENVDIEAGETNKEYFFDWQAMRGFDPDTISKTRDVRSMNEILTIFMQCRFNKSDYLFVRNRDIFQILRLLWICINYQLEMQERFKYHFSKLKEKNAALRKAERCTKSELIKATAEINKWKYGDRCPVCEAACDSKESVDAHVQEFHGHLYEHWMCVRNNEPGKTDQENHKLKHEVATLRDQVKRYEREQTFRNLANLDDKNTEMARKRSRRLETNTNIFSVKPPYEPIPQKEPELKTWRMAERYLLPKNRYKDPPECIEQVTDRIAKLMFPHGMGVKEEAEKIHRKYQRTYEVDEGYIVGTNYVCGRLRLGGYTHFQSVFEAPPSEDHGQFSNAEYSGSEDPGVEQLIDEYKSKELKKLQKKAQEKMSRMHITAHDIIDAARKMTNTPKLQSDMVRGHAQSIADNIDRPTHVNQSKDKDPGECSMVSLGSSVSGGARPAKVSTTSGSDKTEVALRPLTDSSSGIPKNPPAASVMNLERKRRRRRQSNQMNEFQSLSDSEELRPLSESDEEEKPKRRRHRVHRKMELSDEPASSSGDQEEEIPQRQRRRRNSIQKVEHHERMKTRPMTHQQLEPLEEEQTKRNLRQKPKTHHQMEKVEDVPSDRDKKGRRGKRQIEESLSDDPGEKKQRQRIPPQKKPKIKQEMEDFDSLSDEEKAKQKPKSRPQIQKQPLPEQKKPDYAIAPNQTKRNENPPPPTRKDPSSEPRAPEVTTPPKPKPKIHQKLEPMEEPQPTSKANQKETPPTKQTDDTEKEPKPKGIIPKPKPKEEPVSEAKRMATAAQSMRDAIAAASMRMYAAAQQPPSPPKPKPVEEAKPQEVNPPPQAKPPEPISKPKQEPQKPKQVVLEDDYEESPSSEKQENPAPEPPKEEVKEEPESNSGLDASDNEFIALLTGM